jgi:conjugative relaxase-like TrwC/TraI family protein
VRYTITPLGSSGGRPISDVVRHIVDYLQRRRPAVSAVEQPGRSGTAAYYADGSEEPGRWLGRGADALGLRGLVQRDDFARLLAGRDPHTGLRLLGAAGSAGRRPTLGVGSATVENGSVRLYGVHDAAVALELDDRDVEALAAAGERAAIGALIARLAGRAAADPREPAGAMLVPVVAADGSRAFTEAELARCHDARRDGVDVASVAAAGSPDDQLTLRDAARLAGVTPAYLRRLARQITSDTEPAHEPKLHAWRGSRGQWLVLRADLVAFLEQRKAPAVRVGYDATLTTEKSLGVLALLSPPPVRDTVLDVIQGANDAGLVWLEERAARGRVRGEPVRAAGWAVASFRHLTSRALDPFPHHHNVIANTVALPDGTRRALDARHLYHHALGASAIATAQARHDLTTRLGVRWTRARHGGWEVDGIPPDVLREFSRRAGDIDDAIAELEQAIGRITTIGELRDVAARTRPAKQQADASALLTDWRQRAQQLGFAAEHLAGCLNRGTIPPEPPAAVIHARVTGPGGICEERSVFTRDDLLVFLVDLPIPSTDGEQPVLVTAARLEELADDYLRSRHVVELHPEDASARRVGGGERIFTTRQVLERQARIVRRYEAGRTANAAVVSDVTLDAVLLRHPHLVDEQRELVRALCTSGMRTQCAVGRPGAGKTSSMRVAVEAWALTGQRVVGAAVKGEAARLLGEAAGIPSETVAWYLANPGRAALGASTVLVVDEASTLSDADLDALMTLTEATGAALRLLGDPAQHGSVGGGGMYRVLCEQFTGDTPELRQCHRLRDDRNRAAADALRDGRIDEALAALADAGQLHVLDDEVAVHAELLLRWWTSRQAGQPHPMVDRSNRTRRHLNRLARRLLQHAGQLGADAVAASDGRAFSVGDEVVARRSDRHLHPPGRRDRYVRNGAVGVVVGTGVEGGEDVVRVDFVGAGVVAVPRSFFDDRPDGTHAGLDHAYAVTSYGVQGATFEVSSSRIDDRASRAEAYVDVTRGRLENVVFLARVEDGSDGERLPRAPVPPIEEAVTRRLARSGPEVTAWELDPSALERARAAEREPPVPAL